MECVLDTYSLIYLSKLNDLGIIFNLFSKIYITNFIIDELLNSKKPRPENKIFNLFIEKYKLNIQIQNVAKDKDFEIINKFMIGFRETSIFLLCKKRKNILVITSDKKAYNKFKVNNINIIKTYEIYKLLYFLKIITKNEYTLKLSNLTDIFGITKKEFDFEINNLK
jgi:predicted nucleic acid-binding protein